MRFCYSCLRWLLIIFKTLPFVLFTSKRCIPALVIRTCGNHESVKFYFMLGQLLQEPNAFILAFIQLVLVGLPLFVAKYCQTPDQGRSHNPRRSAPDSHRLKSPFVQQLNQLSQISRPIKVKLLPRRCVNQQFWSFWGPTLTNKDGLGD